MSRQSRTFGLVALAAALSAFMAAVVLQLTGLTDASRWYLEAASLVCLGGIFLLLGTLALAASWFGRRA